MECGREGVREERVRVREGRASLRAHWRCAGQRTQWVCILSARRLQWHSYGQRKEQVEDRGQAARQGAREGVG